MNRIHRRMTDITAAIFLRLVSVSALFLGTLYLTGCGLSAGADVGTSHTGGTAHSSADTGIHVSEKSLTADQLQVLSLVNTHHDTGIFSYTGGERLKEIHFFVEELKDGTLTSLAAGGAKASASGDISVLLDPDRVQFILDSEEGGGSITWDMAVMPDEYTGSLASRIHELSSVRYNEKTALMSLAQSRDGTIQNINVTDYNDLPGLTKKVFDRVLFFSVAFTDFNTEGALISCHGIVRDSAKLPQETVDWVNRYNQTPIMDQLAISYMPPEFMNFETGSDVKAMETDAAE